LDVLSAVMIWWMKPDRSREVGWHLHLLASVVRPVVGGGRQGS
jgi:hypothetical protein